MMVTDALDALGVLYAIGGSFASGLAHTYCVTLAFCEGGVAITSR